MIDWELGKGFFDNGAHYRITRIKLIKTQPHMGKRAKLLTFPGFYIQKQNERK